MRDDFFANLQDVKLKDATFFNRRGIDFLQVGQFKEAIRCFNQAIGLDPAFSEAYHNLGKAYTRLGQSVPSPSAAGMKEPQKIKKPAAPATLHPDADATGDLYNDLLSVSLTAIDNVWDELFASSPEKIHNVWDECFSDPAEDCSFPAILEFLDGGIENIAKAVLFQPADSDDLTLMEEGGDSKHSFPLNQCSCIRMAGLPAEFAQPKDLSCHVEVIETVNGKSYQKYIPAEQNLKNLLLGFSRKRDNHLKYILFPMMNIRKRTQKRFIGEILIEKGMIDTPDFRKALDVYNRYRQLKFGQIIAKQANILYPAVEVEIQNAYNKGTDGIKVGEILLAAGLVDQQQVSAALAVQKKIRRKKIGQFLIEKGILKEEEVYIALAEKYRMPFIDLRQQTISRRMLTLLPRELILELQILPISQQDSTLVVATFLTDVPVIKDLIAQHTEQKDIQLVLTRPTHLRKIISQLYPETNPDS